MAELILRIGSTANYDEEDILEAFTDFDVAYANAANLADINRLGFIGDRIRPSNTIAEKFRQETYEFRFEVLENGLVEVTNQLTSSSSTHTKEEIGFAIYRRNYRDHFFGSIGREVWYTNPVIPSEQRLENVWEFIEDTFRGDEQ
jgi:hypothetical protein